MSDDDRRRLAVYGYRLGHRGLSQVATVATPDTIFGRWSDVAFLKGDRVDGAKLRSSDLVLVQITAKRGVLTEEVVLQLWPTAAGTLKRS